MSHPESFPSGFQPQDRYHPTQERRIDKTAKVENRYLITVTIPTKMSRRVYRGTTEGCSEYTNDLVRLLSTLYPGRDDWGIQVLVLQHHDEAPHLAAGILDPGHENWVTHTQEQDKMENDLIEARAKQHGQRWDRHNRSLDYPEQEAIPEAIPRTP